MFLQSSQSFLIVSQCGPLYNRGNDRGTAVKIILLRCSLFDSNECLNKQYQCHTKHPQIFLPPYLHIQIAMRKCMILKLIFMIWIPLCNFCHKTTNSECHYFSLSIFHYVSSFEGQTNIYIPFS